MGAVTIERPVKTSTLSKKKVKDGLSTAMRLSRRIFASLRHRDVVISGALVAVLVVSAIGVVISAHENRELFNTLSQLHGERDDLQREWSQLLLEQSALSAHGRIEQQAAERLGMVVPGKQDIVLVPSTAGGNVAIR